MNLTEEINNEIEYLNSVNTRPCTKLVIDVELYKGLARDGDLMGNGKYGELEVEVIDGYGVFRWKLI